MGQKLQEYDLNKIVFAIFKNDILKVELEKWASLNDVKIKWGDPDSQDIIFCNCFASIIDRNIISSEQYSLFLDYTKGVNTPIDYEERINKYHINPQDIEDLKEDMEIGDESTCILLDSIQDLEYPKLDFVLQVNIQKENAIQWIIDFLDLSLKHIRIE